jgi:sulfatase maturation enzyme AslB (radical SAM superfamily)
MGAPTKPSTTFKIRGESLGWHLFDRNSGLHLLFDEVRCPAIFQAPVPRFVSIALTNTCDLACDYCYAPKHRARLNGNEVNDWCRDLDRAGALGIGFGGGEPTLWPGFAGLCRNLSERTNLAVSMTTHGHRLDDKLCDQLRGAVHFVRVSTDGVGNTYERMRRRPFEDLRRALHRARSVAPLGINMVVNSQTVGDLDGVYDLSLEVDAAEIALLPERAVGARPGASPAVLETLRTWLSDALARETGPRLCVAAGFPLGSLTGSSPTIEDYAHIDASGRLHRTSFGGEGIEIGRMGIVDAFTRLEALV